jgi:hypothetical protein
MDINANTEHAFTMIVHGETRLRLLQGART